MPISSGKMRGRAPADWTVRDRWEIEVNHREEKDLMGDALFNFWSVGLVSWWSAIAEGGLTSRGSAGGPRLGGRPYRPPPGYPWLVAEYPRNREPFEASVERGTEGRFSFLARLSRGSCTSGRIPDPPRSPWRRNHGTFSILSPPLLGRILSHMVQFRPTEDNICQSPGIVKGLFAIFPLCVTAAVRARCA